MSTRTGFPRMDWDTGFLADPKFQHLRDLLPDPVQFGYAGFCYLRLVADAWRTCERRTIRDVVRGIEAWAITALHEAGLLEEDFVLPEAAFEHWIGDAIQGRKTHAESVRKSRSVTVTDGHRPSVPISGDITRVGTVGSVGNVLSEASTTPRAPARSPQTEAVIEDIQHAEYESSRLADRPLSDFLERPV